MLQTNLLISPFRCSFRSVNFCGTQGMEWETQVLKYFLSKSIVMWWSVRQDHQMHTNAKIQQLRTLHQLAFGFDFLQLKKAWKPCTFLRVLTFLVQMHDTRSDNQTSLQSRHNASHNHQHEIQSQNCVWWVGELPKPKFCAGYSYQCCFWCGLKRFPGLLMLRPGLYTKTNAKHIYVWSIIDKKNYYDFTLNPQPFSKLMCLYLKWVRAKETTISKKPATHTNKWWWLCVSSDVSNKGVIYEQKLCCGSNTHWVAWNNFSM